MYEYINKCTFQQQRKALIGILSYRFLYAPEVGRYHSVDLLLVITILLHFSIYLINLKSASFHERMFCSRGTVTVNSNFMFLPLH